MKFVPNGDLCPFCAGADLRRYRARAHDAGNSKPEIHIIECRRCEFAWQWPRARTVRESIDFFRSNYSKPVAGSYFDVTQRRRTAYLEMQFLQELLPEKGTILDVGSGTGTFIQVAAELGWTAVGIDPAAEMRKTPEGVELISGTVEDIPRGRTFDIVCLLSVLEHVDNPELLIEQCVAHVNSDGYLVVATPNYQSADRIQGGSDWWAFQLDHQWYHSPTVLGKLMERAGLGQIIYAKSAFRPWHTGPPRYQGPSAYLHAKTAIRRPSRIWSEWCRYAKLRQCERKWPEWSGLPRMTIAAKRDM